MLAFLTPGFPPEAALLACVRECCSQVPVVPAAQRPVFYIPHLLVFFTLQSLGKFLSLWECLARIGANLQSRLLNLKLLISFLFAGHSRLPSVGCTQFTSSLLPPGVLTNGHHFTLLKTIPFVYLHSLSVS